MQLWHEGLDAVFYSSPSKGRSWKVFVHSCPRWLGVRFFLLGSKTPCKSLTGSTGFNVCGWLWYPCCGLSSAPASLAQSSCSCDRFCDPFPFREDVFWAQVLPEWGNRSVWELVQQRVDKGKCNALNWTPILCFQLCCLFLACTPHSFFFKSPKMSSNSIPLCRSAERAGFFPLYL